MGRAAMPRHPRFSPSVAGISGATPGSCTEGDDENDGRFMLPHAPRSIASAEAIPRLPIARALSDLTIEHSPGKIRVAAPVPQPSVKLLSEQ